MGEPGEDTVDATGLDALCAAGLLDRPGYRAALLRLRSREEWIHFLDQLLLFSGAALLLAGIVFFFAYNWADMPTWGRFATVEVAMVAAVGGALLLGLDHLPGKVLLTAAAFLIGVFLAVFGQTYQTGADAYQLFLGWAALALPWVAVSRFGAAWFLELVLVVLTVGLWSKQVAEPAGWIADPTAATLAGLTALAGLGLREGALRSGRTYLGGAWWRRAALAVALLPLTVAGDVWVHEIVDHGRLQARGLFAFLALAGALAATFPAYRRRLPDLGSLTLVVASLATIPLVGGMTLVNEISHGIFFSRNFFGLAMWALLQAGVVLGVGMAAGAYLRGIAREGRDTAAEGRA